MQWVVVGGAGFVGAAICRELAAHGCSPHIIDRAPPRQPGNWSWSRTDLLKDSITLPAGRIVLTQGSSLPRPIRPWTLALDNAMSTARLAPHLKNRDVVLLSSVEVYGTAAGPLTENTPPDLPLDLPRLAEWSDRAVQTAQTGPCPPHRSYPMCKELADLDPTGRWVYAMSKLAQEEIVRRYVPPERLTILRLANVVGPGQFRFVGRLVDAAVNGTPCYVTDTVRGFVSVSDVARTVREVEIPGVYNVSSGTTSLADVAALVGNELGLPLHAKMVQPPDHDSCGVVDSTCLQSVILPLTDVKQSLRECVRLIADDPSPVFAPSLPVVVPPRPERPDLVGDRMAEALWTGRLRGGPWADALGALLEERLQLGADRRILLTDSGTSALRLAVSAVAGPPIAGAVALCPAYTFHATSEVLRQLGWSVRHVDVERTSWTLDPGELEKALTDPAVGVVVAVDALGNPCDYDRLTFVCRSASVPLIADSAPALGAQYNGNPVGRQADAHAFSMSFAKTVSAGGSGGAVVLPAHAQLQTAENWWRSSRMSELSAIAALDNLVALDELIARRERVARVYQQGISNLPGFESQTVRYADRHTWVHWVVRVPLPIGRDEFAKALAAQGVGTKPYYEAVASSGTGLSTEAAALHEQGLALPMSSELTTDEAQRVIAAVRRVARRLTVKTTRPIDTVVLTSPHSETLRQS